MGLPEIPRNRYEAMRHFRQYMEVGLMGVWVLGGRGCVCARACVIACVLEKGVCILERGRSDDIVYVVVACRRL